jgi:hypothetical protein
MAISYAWDVKTVDTYPTKDSKSDVVYNVHWRLTATDDANNDAEGEPQTASSYGSQILDTEDLKKFTEFNKLKLTQVEAWVIAAMGEEAVTELKTNLDAAIAEKITPTSVQKIID